jgi:hypothetical protein
VVVSSVVMMEEICQAFVNSGITNVIGINRASSADDPAAKIFTKNLYANLAVSFNLIFSCDNLREGWKVHL